MEVSAVMVLLWTLAVTEATSEGIFLQQRTVAQVVCLIISYEHLFVGIAMKWADKWAVGKVASLPYLCFFPLVQLF